MCKEGKEEKEEESRAHKRENTHAGNHVVRTLIKKKWKDSSVNTKYNFDLQQTVILLIYVLLIEYPTIRNIRKYKLAILFNGRKYIDKRPISTERDVNTVRISSWPHLEKCSLGTKFASYIYTIWFLMPFERKMFYTTLSKEFIHLETEIE